jgi:hypothetical protein
VTAKPYVPAGNNGAVSPVSPSNGWLDYLWSAPRKRRSSLISLLLNPQRRLGVPAHVRILCRRQQSPLEEGASHPNLEAQGYVCVAALVFIYVPGHLFGDGNAIFRVHLRARRPARFQPNCAGLVFARRKRKRALAQRSPRRAQRPSLRRAAPCQRA